MYLSLYGARGLTEWPFGEPVDGVYCEQLVLYSRCPLRALMAVCRIAHPCFEWFSLPRSASSAPCVGGIDRSWIGLRQAWLLMSVCAETRGNAGAPRAKPEIASGKRGRGVMHLSVLVTRSVNTTCLHTHRWHNLFLECWNGLCVCVCAFGSKYVFGGILGDEKALAHHTSKLLWFRACSFLQFRVSEGSWLNV